MALVLRPDFVQPEHIHDYALSVCRFRDDPAGGGSSFREFSGELKMWDAEPDGT